MGIYDFYQNNSLFNIYRNEGDKTKYTYIIGKDVYEMKQHTS